MSNTAKSPSHGRPITAFRFNPANLPRCAYYALTGPDRETLMDLRNECWSEPGKPPGDCQLIPVQLWGYDLVQLSPIKPNDDESMPIVLTVQINLTVRLHSLTIDADYIKGGYLLLRLNIASIGDYCQLTSIKHLLSARYRSPTANTDPQPSLPLSPFASNSLLEVIYQPDLHLGRLLSCTDPVRDVACIFSHIPSICQNDPQGLLPLEQWPHWPNQHGSEILNFPASHQPPSG